MFTLHQELNIYFFNKNAWSLEKTFYPPAFEYAFLLYEMLIDTEKLGYCDSINNIINT